MRYFDHDTSAADDDKIMALRIECGGAAVDAYWAVLELMYRDETDLVFGRNLVGTKALCHRLCVGFDDLSEWLSAMERVGLLRIVENAENTVADGDDRAVTYSSDRVTANISAYAARCETARENGKRGGRKPKANRVGSKSVSKTKPKANRVETEGKAKEKEKEKSLVTHKGLPNDYATGAAAADGAAPPAAESTVPRCPMCRGTMRYDPSERLWRCKDDGCRATVKPHELSRCFERDDPGGETRPHCPLCDSRIKPPPIPGMDWECPTCGEIKDGAVVWR